MEDAFTKKTSTELRLQFYKEHPQYNVSLEKIEELAIERLKVLRCVEMVGQEFKGKKSYNDKLSNELYKCSNLGISLSKFSDSTINVSKNDIKNEIKNDVLSQFILSLAYCRTEELAKWFIHQELELFEYRFTMEANHNAETIKRFTEINKITLQPASSTDMDAILKDYQGNIDGVIFYKVRCEEVPDLLKKRKCWINAGFVFLVNVMDICSVVMSRLRIHLSHTLTLLRANIDVLDEDERIRPLLSTLNKRYLGKSYDVQSSEKVFAAQIPALSKKSFPPCMNQIHTTLTREHHLKHAARMQYGLFLKGIGLPLEEALRFWSESFQPNTDGDSFAKKYAYNIRHNYGQEGKRVNYTPYSCVKIITTSATTGCSGCPFQTTSSDQLRQNLKSNSKATEEQIKSIVDTASNRQFQISCRNYFKMMHGLPNEHPVSINHPNEYFEESQKIYKQK